MSDINFFTNIGTLEIFKAGDRIFEAGQPGNSMYGVAEGEVDILLPDGVSITIPPGGVFGEMSLLDKEPRSATAVAKTDCNLVFLNETRFLIFAQWKPQFVFHLMRSLSTRFRRRQAQLMQQIEQLQSGMRE